jgi:hypothetical protein
MAAVHSTKIERIGHAEFRLPRARGSEESASAESPEDTEGEAAAMHEPSHRRLLERVPHYLPGQRTLRLGSIIIPAARAMGTGSGLAVGCRFATATDTQLVVIRSGAALSEPFPEAFLPRTTLPTVVIDLPDGADSILPWQSNEYVIASLHRDTDLGLKRNLGLLLARMQGLEAILYLDDDISVTPASRLAARAVRDHPWPAGDPLARLNDVLASFAASPDLHAAGYFQQDFDDNSVFCHARRLVGRAQETFISGGAHALRVDGPLPFFSRAYNEDWLFFLFLMLEGPHTFPFGGVRYVGTIHQDAYYPFSVLRARSEEFGDLFAERLFAVLGTLPREELLVAATRPSFWEVAIDSRCVMIDSILEDLYRLSPGIRGGAVLDARRAMQAARDMYAEARDLAGELGRFFAALIADREEWRKLLDSVTPRSPADALSLPDALKVVGLDTRVTFLGGDGSHDRRAS